MTQPRLRQEVARMGRPVIQDALSGYGADSCWDSGLS